MMTRRTAAGAALLLLTATLLTGCGKADLGPVWFPLKEGGSITYAITQTGEEAPAPEEWTLRVTAPATLDQVPVVHKPRLVNDLPPLIESLLGARVAAAAQLGRTDEA